MCKNRKKTIFPHFKVALWPWPWSQGHPGSYHFEDHLMGCLCAMFHYFTVKSVTLVAFGHEPLRTTIVDFGRERVNSNFPVIDSTLAAKYSSFWKIWYQIHRWENSGCGGTLKWMFEIFAAIFSKSSFSYIHDKKFD